MVLSYGSTGWRNPNGLLGTPSREPIWLWPSRRRLQLRSSQSSITPKDSPDSKRTDGGAKIRPCSQLPLTRKLKHWQLDGGQKSTKGGARERPILGRLQHFNEGENVVLDDWLAETARSALASTERHGPMIRRLPLRRLAEEPACENECRLVAESVEKVPGIRILETMVQCRGQL